MAAPHVAGAAARVLGAAPGTSPANVWATLSAAATNIDFAPGSGDPDKLLYVDPGLLITKSLPPRSVTVAASNGAANVSWLTPTSNGGSPITSYTARAYSQASGGSPVSTCTPSPATDLSCTISSLSNGTAFYVDVIATNQAIGASDPSSPRKAVTPINSDTIPGAPQSVAVTPGVGRITATWEAPASNGGNEITSYTARAWTAAGSGSIVRFCTPVPATSLSCSIEPLTNATTYYVDVIATNVRGPGTASSPRVSATPADVPGSGADNHSLRR